MGCDLWELENTLSDLNDLHCNLGRVLKMLMQSRWDYIKDKVDNRACYVHTKTTVTAGMLGSFHRNIQNYKPIHI